MTHPVLEHGDTDIEEKKSGKCIRLGLKEVKQALQMGLRQSPGERGHLSSLRPRRPYRNGFSSLWGHSGEDVHELRFKHTLSGVL